MKSKYYFLILNILIACLFASPIIFANESGGSSSGGDSDDESGGNEGDSDSAEKAGEDAENSINEAMGDISGMVNGVDMGNLGSIGNMNAQAAYSEDQGRSSFSFSVETEAGTLSVSCSVDENGEYSTSFSVATKSGTGIDGSYSDLGSALSAQETANANESSVNGLVSFFTTLALGLIGLISGPVGMMATAIGFGFSVGSIASHLGENEDNTIGTWVESKFESWGNGFSYLSKTVTKSYEATQDAKMSSQTQEGVAIKDGINNKIESKNLPDESVSNGKEVISKDPRDESSPKYATGGVLT